MLITRIDANAANMRILNNTNVIYPELSYKINGILFAVHNELGRFCNEKQYGDAIEGWFKKLKFDYRREVVLPPSFESERPGRNRVDFLIENKIILEIKAKPFVGRDEYYQARRYQTAFNAKLTLLVNFRQRYLYPKRILNPLVKN